MNACLSYVKPELPDTTVLTEWIQLKKDMSRGTGGAVSPNRFVHMIHRIAQQKGRDLFTGFAQNDMPEFLLFLIECMHNSVCRPVNMRISGKTENAVDHLAIQCYTMLKDTYAKEYSEFMELFYGIYVSRITSMDNQVHSLKPESFFILDLPLSGESIQTMEQCFDRYVETETLSGENAWFNEKTGESETANKNMVFWNLPKILVVLLKRFSADGQRKNGAQVMFPIESMNLSKYVAGYNPQSYQYELFGVCNHMGNVAGGHYTAFTKMGETWYHFNDTRVDIVLNPAQMVTPAAYCLFYRKKNKGV